MKRKTRALLVAVGIAGLAVITNQMGGSQIAVSTLMVLAPLTALVLMSRGSELDGIESDQP